MMVVLREIFMGWVGGVEREAAAFLFNAVDKSQA